MSSSVEKADTQGIRILTPKEKPPTPKKTIK